MVINPLENLDESKIIEMENFVGQFYDLVKSSQVNNIPKLNQFVNEIDIENILSEHESLNVDLKQLLGLNDS
jgi:hypothetical protein